MNGSERFAYLNDSTSVQISKTLGQSPRLDNTKKNRFPIQSFPHVLLRLKAIIYKTFAFHEGYFYVISTPNWKISWRR